MKKLLLKTMLLLCALVAGMSSAWAETTTYQHVFNAKPSTGSNIVLSSVKWNVAATNLNGYNSGNYAGVQIGSSKNDGSITLTSSSAWGEESGTTYEGKTKVTEVRLWLNLGGTTVTPTVTIGGKTATSDGTTVTKNSSAGSDWTKATKVTFTPAAGGDKGQVVINVETVKAGYICCVEIDCETPPAAAVATPTFSVAGGTYTTTQSVELNCATDGATIYYTTDGSEPTSSSSVYSTPVAINESCTLKAIAIKGGEESSVASATYTINLPKSYNLATSIISGKHYVITNGKDGSVKVLDSQSSNNRASIDAEITSGILNATGAYELLIQGPNADGYYTIYDVNNNGYLYAASSSSNYLRNKSELDSNGTWSIEISGEGVATIKAQGTNTRNWIRNNGNLFSCYASGQSDVYLFEKEGESAPEESVTIGSTGYATYCSNNALNFAGSGITAYMAKASGSSVTLTAIEEGVVPAREGVVLKGSANTYNVPVATALGSNYDASENEMVGLVVASTVDATVDDKYNYILSNEDAGVGFYRAVDGVQLAANKAYLSTTVDAAVRDFLGFTEGDSDAVIEIAKNEKMSAIYDLSGRRVVKPTKGLYIVNGKKVVK